MGKKFFSLVLLFAFVLFFSSLAKSQELHLEVRIFDDGSCLLTGTATEDPNIKDVEYEKGILYGLSQSFTSKKKEIWHFHLETEKSFSYSLKIILPENSKLLGINKQAIIFTENKAIVVETSGKDKLDILLTYTKDVKPKQSSFLTILAIIVFMVIVLFFLAFFFMKKRKKRVNKKILDLLNERERLILKLLSRKRRISYGTLQKLSKIPKASFSRHIKALENKKLIKRTGKGRLSFIELK